MQNNGYQFAMVNKLKIESVTDSHTYASCGQRIFTLEELKYINDAYIGYISVGIGIYCCSASVASGQNSNPVSGENNGPIAFCDARNKQITHEWTIYLF